MLETFEMPDYSSSSKTTYEQREFCDIGLVVTLGERCKLCQRKLVHADCEKWLAKSNFKPYPAPYRYVLIGIFVAMGLTGIALLGRLFQNIESLSYLGVMLLGQSLEPSDAISNLGFGLPPYPFTIQNMTILLFFAGLGESVFRMMIVHKEKTLLRGNYLPESRRAVLDVSNLAKVRRSIGEVHSEEQGFLFVLIDLCTKRFMNSESIEQTMTALKSKLDLMGNKIDLHYTFLRYLIWVIPTVGFIGTVLGISFAILGINPVNLNLESVVAGLGVAFHTTLVSLILSALLNLIYNLVSSAEENALNKAGSYVLNNMVNRLDPSLDQGETNPAPVMKVPSISRG